MNKYRALVSEIREKEKKSNSGTDMEVSWIPSDVVNEQVKKGNAIDVMKITICIKTQFFLADNSVLHNYFHRSLLS